MDELEKKPETPQEPAARRPEKKNDFDNRRKLMYILCGGYLIYLAIKMGRDYPQRMDGRADRRALRHDRLCRHRRGAACSRRRTVRARMEGRGAARAGTADGRS